MAARFMSRSEHSFNNVSREEIGGLERELGIWRRVGPRFNDFVAPDGVLREPIEMFRDFLRETE